MDVSALRMREATIIAGIWLTWGVGALGGLYVALTWSRPHRFELALLFGFAILAGFAVLLLPRERIVRSRLREPFFLSWTLLDFVMVVIGTLLDGGTSSPLILVFFIPIVFSSMSYPLASVIAVGLSSIGSYLAVALTAGGSSPAYQAAFALALACTAAMSAWQAQNHNRQNRVLATVSRTDALTGCLNRRGFVERAEAQLGGMRRTGAWGAMLVLDIDHFKPVNDRYGHAAGDELLCWVSNTLEKVVRTADAVGRLGGDEFAVLFTDIDPTQARLLATRVDEALTTRAPASLGLAVFPDDGLNLDELTRKADTRLYAARQARRRGAEERKAVESGGSAPGSGQPPSPLDRSGEGGTAEGGSAPIELWRAALDTMPTPLPGPAPSGVNDLQAILLDQIDASVMVVAMDGTIISWNRGAEALYGWSREEAVGANTRQLLVPEDKSAAEQLLVELQRDGRWDGELIVKRKDGSTFTCYVRNRLILNDDGSPSAVVGVGVDISKRVAAETELLESRDYARAVAECMGEGLFTLDVGGRLTYINRAAEQLLGFSEADVLGRDVHELICPGRPRASRRRFEESPFGRALADMDTIRVADDLFATAGGAEIPVAYTATPVRTDAGVQGCVVIFGDISDRKRREAENRRDAETLAIINRVESALLDERFVLHAQPIIDLRTRETVQHELLLRMREPDGRLIAPGEFLPVAEQYALVGEIDWWVIKQAAQIAGAGCPVQLNISARSVGDLDVLEHIERCIVQCAVPPGSLVFEITETAIIDDERSAREFVEGLHALGCKVALDDFGTGWGSLTYLKQIPVDFLKLDIEFVRDLATNSASLHVVEAVTNLARDFHLRTVAEGVEDAETLELLSRLDVDWAQGFHIATPEPFAERPGDRSSAPPGHRRRRVEERVGRSAAATRPG